MGALSATLYFSFSASSPLQFHIYSRHGKPNLVSFFFELLLGPYYTIILGFLLRYNIPLPPSVFYTLSNLPLPWVSDGPAVIEDIRLVFAELIRLGGPKRQTFNFLKGKPGITGQPQEKCGVPS